MPHADKHRIRKPDGHDIVGILESPDAVASSRPAAGASAADVQLRPIVLILHGLLAHKDQIYHRRLVKELLDEGLPSFRYDLTGQGGETDGKFELSNFHDDADDLDLVVRWLQSQGYAILMIVAHSRGTMITSLYLSTRPHPFIPLYAQVSGRWDLTRIMRESTYSKSLGGDDQYDWKVRVAGKEVVKTIRRADTQRFAEFDNSFVITSFPQDVHVINIHGLDDAVVPHGDSDKLHTVLSQRSPGTSELAKIPNAGHNWSRPFDEPVNTIMSWFKRHRKEAERRLLSLPPKGHHPQQKAHL